MKTALKKMLKGERITLKRSDPSIVLATKIFKAVDRNRDYLFPWLNWVQDTKKVEDSLQFLFDTQERFKRKEECVYSIFL